MNEAGGRVWTSAGGVSQNDFATYVNSGLYEGDVHIISGVHGTPSGGIIVDQSLFEADFAKFGRMPGVSVYNFSEMTADQIQTVLRSPGTVIGGFCNSGVCLAPFR
jgi:hypothetical protein